MYAVMPSCVRPLALASRLSLCLEVPSVPQNANYGNVTYLGQLAEVDFREYGCGDRIRRRRR